MPPVSPCGHVVDVIRAAYTGQYRFWRDSDLLLPIRWYFVPETRPVLPFPTPFSDWAWDNDNTYRPFWIVGTPLQGDDIDSRHARNAGRPPNPDPFGLSPHVCGTESQWAGDLLIGRDLPLRPSDCPCLSPGGLQAGRGGGVGGGWSAIRWNGPEAPPLILGRGSGVGGGVCEFNPRIDIDCLGSGVGGGSGSMAGPPPPACADLPAAPDLMHVDVSAVSDSPCGPPAWPAVVPLTRTADPCIWQTPLYAWGCAGVASVRWQLDKVGGSWFLRLVGDTGANEGTNWFTAAAGWSGGLPRGFAAGTSSFRWTTIPGTITLTA